MEHGGRIVAKVLKSRGVTHLFTLSGGHLFSIYDGCKEEGIEIVDVRHEQTATFAAEGFAKATRGVGVAALTAGPGVTNGISAIAGRPGQRLADLRARRAGAGDALGLGLASGVRPHPGRRAARQVGRDGARGTARIAASHGGGARPGARRSLGPDLRRLPARRRLQRGGVRGPGCAGGGGGVAAPRASRRRRRCSPPPSGRS